MNVDRLIDDVMVVDSNFWAPSDVKNLTLKMAGLTHISPSIAALEHLEILDLSDNQITSLPRMQSTGLKKLYVDSRSFCSEHFNS